MQLTQVLAKQKYPDLTMILSPTAAAPRVARTCASAATATCTQFPLISHLLTFPRARKGVIDFALRSVDILERRRGAERGL